MKRADLEQAAIDNWTVMNGMDDEQLRDLGYSTPDTVRDDIDATMARQIEIERGEPLSMVQSARDTISALEALGQEGKAIGAAKLAHTHGDDDRRYDLQVRYQERTASVFEVAERTKASAAARASIFLARARGHVTFTEGEDLLSLYSSNSPSISAPVPVRPPVMPVFPAEVAKQITQDVAKFRAQYATPERPRGASQAVYARERTATARARTNYKHRLETTVRSADQAAA